MVRYTQIPASTTVTIANGDTIDVAKIHASSNAGSSGIINFFERDGTTLIFSVQIRSTGTTFSHESSVEWRAINGLVVNVGAGVSCTVYYSQSGT